MKGLGKGGQGPTSGCRAIEEEEEEEEEEVISDYRGYTVLTCHLCSGLSSDSFT
jgi:hypothetical protein